MKPITETSVTHQTEKVCFKNEYETRAYLCLIQITCVLGHCTYIDILTNFLRGLEASIFSLSTLTSGCFPLRTAEWAPMPETAPLSASQIFYFFKMQVKKSIFGDVEIFASPSLKLLFFWNTTY